MKKRNHKPNRARKRTSKTVHPTHLTVVSTGIGETEEIKLRHVNDLLKASILYADDVELLSPMTDLIDRTRMIEDGITENAGQFLQAIDDQTLIQLAGQDTLKKNQMDIGELRFALFLLGMDSKDRAELLKDTPEGDYLEEHLSQIEESIHGPEMDDMLSKLHQMREDSGVEELRGVISSHTVTFNRRLSNAINSDDLLDQFLDELIKTLNDQYKLVLLDTSASSLVTAMQDEGVVAPSSRAISNAREAALGTGFISYLPAFTTAPMDEIVDLRSDLDALLSRYRADVAALRGEMKVGPFDANIEGEILAIWRTRVEPEIQEIRSAMADHGLVREIVRAVGGDLKGLRNGTWAPAAIGTVIAATTGVHGAVAAGIGAFGSAGLTALKVAEERSHIKRDLESHDFYYLYQANETLSSLA